MFKHCLTLKLVKREASNYFPKGEKNRKFCRALEGVNTEEITDFQNGRRMFWGRTSKIH